MTFANYEGEDADLTATWVASLEVAIQGARDRGEADSVKQMEAELHRMRGGSAKQTRPRGSGKQTR